MAIFGKDGTQQGSRHGTTVVAAGSQFVGNVALSDNLHVDGKVEGEVDGEAGVVIGEQGVLKGSIRASSVVVSGRVEGSIVAKRLEIVSGGIVEGDVQTVDLVIEPGGRFNGSSEILDERAHEAVRDEAVRENAPRKTGAEAAPAAKKSGAKAGLSGDESPSAT
jgi:cytoskeletal protein CcmA (bactofilin family)